MKKILLSLFMLIGTMCSASAATTTIWTGSHYVSWDLDDGDPNKEWKEISKEQFAGFAVGSELVFTLESVTTDFYHQYKLDDWNWDLLPGQAPADVPSDGRAVLTVTSEIKSAVAEKGFAIHGHGFNVKKAELITEDEPEPETTDIVVFGNQVSVDPNAYESGYWYISVSTDDYYVYLTPAQQNTDPVGTWSLSDLYVDQEYGICLYDNSVAKDITAVNITVSQAGDNYTIDGAIVASGVTYVLYVSTVAVTFNSKGYATFSAGKNLKVKTTAVTAYKATVNGDEIILTQLDVEKYIPAGNGVILKGNEGTKVEFEAPDASDGYADMEDNALKATTKADGSLATKEDDSWALNGDEFLQFTGEEYTANRAYLVHEAAAANELHIVFADAEQGNTTDIENIEASKQSLTYDLNGRRATAKGLQIKNGKAVFVK